MSDKYKFLYCFVPKVACTNWKRIILSLNGKNITGTQVHRTFIPSLLAFSKREIEKRLQDYTKVLIVRNPHERLLSAYTDKLQNENFQNNITRSHFTPKMLKYNIQFLQKKYNLNTSQQDAMRNARTNRKLSFQEFIRYVGDVHNKMGHPAEEHWREISRLCDPCSVQYDFIGKLETMDDDTKYILSHIGADHLTNILNIRTHPTNSSSENEVQAAFRQVTEEDVVQFEKRFKMDMELFDYQRPTRITQFKSEEEDRRDTLIWANYTF